MEPEPPENALGPGIVVLGRFQPIHKGHAILIDAANRWRNSNDPEAPLIIAIGSSNRTESIRNPWSSEERRGMLGDWLSSAGISAQLVEIPDIDDPPNWVSHSEKYHGESGVFFTTDLESAELYEAAGWKVVLAEHESREVFEGWRVRATVQMMSTVSDTEAVRSVLNASIPDAVISNMLENDLIGRLAFLGEGGEPVG